MLTVPVFGATPSVNSVTTCGVDVKFRIQTTTKIPGFNNKQHYLDYQGKERTLRRFIRSLRIQYNIKKPVIQRQYQAVEELPMGYQAQVDLGFTTLVNTQGQRVKLTGFGLVLSHSRYYYLIRIIPKYKFFHLIDTGIRSF